MNARTLLVCGGTLLWLVRLCSAEVVFPPPWSQSLPKQTSQEWDTQMNSGTQMVPPNPGFENPYGLPTVSFTGAEVVPEVGPHEQIIPTWHISDPLGGTLTIKVPNNPDPDLYKLVFWQITADKSVTPTGDPPTTDPPGTSLPTGLPAIRWGAGTWYTYNGLIRIEPNPEFETITFQLVESTNISEIVVNTVCVPEPGCLGLLAAGAVVVGIGRRRLRA